MNLTRGSLLNWRPCSGLAIAALILIAIAMVPASMTAGELRRHEVVCEGFNMQYVLEAPPSASHQALPALLLLHGAGDQAENFIRAWEPLAKKKNLALIAPQLPRDPKFETAAPKIFRCILDDVGKQVRLDPHRIYLFGHSMGGYLAYDAALLDSGYYAAAAIHAMGIADEYASLVDRATRKLPIAIYIGSNDEMVSLRQVEKTRDRLKKAGFPVHYSEIPEHGHNYYELSGVINSDVWHFLASHRLP